MFIVFGGRRQVKPKNTNWTRDKHETANHNFERGKDVAITPVEKAESVD